MMRSRVIMSLLIGGLLVSGCAKKVVIEDADAGKPSVSTSAPQGGQVIDGLADREKYAFFSPTLGKIYLDGTSLYTVHFDFDKSELRDDTRRILDNNVLFLRNNASTRVVIEGHADERGTNEYNIALGDRRAKAIKDYLVTSGIEANRMETISYGEEKPVDGRSVESAWSKNRRGEFVAVRN
ncbi:peptidoglycan-associated lipoprotein Pal [Chrysiogenes arsenatis]|uniref:peptidoglycan-associated lipoprotein Pal n=1 Tax=Chrysiogenes arsenatis TaxID=309797 RepID=UPI000409CB4E|nr:peptidoglycan-associated lipoprotein Pal [Chrysiogenes arsenatis]